MKKQPGNRNYNATDADLYLRSMDTLRNAHRDLEHFKKYGVGEERLRTFKSMVDQFGSLPDDEEFVGDQMIATEKKAQAADNLKAAIRSMMTRVGSKYHNRTGRYRKFGTRRMKDMSDPQLLFCGRRVARVARQQIDFLADTGVNEGLIQRILDACAALETAMNVQQDKWHDRDIAVERRMDQGNKIYKEMVALCDIGKDIWINDDVVKYEQYVIYESNFEEKKERKKRTPAAATVEKPAAAESKTGSKKEKSARPAAAAPAARKLAVAQARW